MVDLFELNHSIDDVAVLVSLPSSEEEFEEDLHVALQRPEDGRGDFALLQWDNRSRCIDTLSNFLSNALNFGLPSNRLLVRAGLSDLSRASADGTKILIVLSHCRSVKLHERDLTDGAAAFLANKLDEKRSPLLANMQSYFSSVDIQCREIETMPRKKLSMLMNKFIASHVPKTGHLKFDIERTVRDAIDVELAGYLAPGLAIEFRDGVHKPHTLKASMDDRWCGICDLAVCHSLPFALALQGERTDRRFLSNEDEKFLDRSLSELTEAIAILSNAPVNYLVIRSKIDAFYSAQVRERIQ